MFIGIIGGAGKAGSLITEEAKNRNHDVTAIVRDATKLNNQEIAVIEKDLFDLTTADLTKFDVVVNAFNAPSGKEDMHVSSHRHLINILTDTNTRLIVVGGAGSLYVDEEKTTHLFETPDFPDFIYPTASNMTKALKLLQSSEGINWTHLSPAIQFDYEGERTGEYKVGKDHVLVNANGDSYISYRDYAIALVDEIENPTYEYTRFAVVSQ